MQRFTDRQTGWIKCLCPYRPSEWQRANIAEATTPTQKGRQTRQLGLFLSSFSCWSSWRIFYSVPSELKLLFCPLECVRHLCEPTYVRMHKPAYLYARTKVRNNHTTIQQHDWERQQQPFFDDGISRTRRSICEQEVAATSASHAGRRVLAGPRYRQQRLECRASIGIPFTWYQVLKEWCQHTGLLIHIFLL